MESGDNIGLSDIIDILNTLDDQNQQVSAALNATITKSNTDQQQQQQQQQQHAQQPQQGNGAAVGAGAAIVSLPKRALPHPLNQSTSSPLLGQTAMQQATHHVLGNSVANSGNVAVVQKPYIHIVEQPASKALRFRYECEGRSAGSIPGVNSTSEIKTYPTIDIVGYKGDVVVVVSCVTKDAPYRPHPHNLVGKESCKNGICTVVLNGEPLRAVFSNLGIQCVKKKDIRSALETREKMQVDPFKTKFAHKDQPSGIDLNVVRLCFQAFLKTASGVKPLTPVVSDPIYDKKAMSDLVICRLCSCTAKVGGGDEIILLCEKIAKDDVKVRFFEQNGDGAIVWEDHADFHPTDIHKQTAIAFRTPRYHNTDIVDKARVFVQLVRPSDGVTSEALPFEFYPDPDQIKRKRLRTTPSPMTYLKRELQKHEQMQTEFNDIPVTQVNNATIWNPPTFFMTDIKAEPAMSPQHLGPYRSPVQMSPSPQPSPINRNALTPSPVGLRKTHSAGSQTQMNDLFSNGDFKPTPTTIDNSNTLSPPSVSPGINTAFVASAYVAAGVGAVSRSSSNSSVNHAIKGTRTSGGSITPLWNATDANGTTNLQSPLAQFLNFQTTQVPNTSTQPPLLFESQLPLPPAPAPASALAPPSQSQPHQFQYQPNHYNVEQQVIQANLPPQLPDDIDILASAEEGPTLSGLLALMDSEQLMPIDELQLSNLSITT